MVEAPQGSHQAPGQRRSLTVDRGGFKYKPAS